MQWLNNGGNMIDINELKQQANGKWPGIMDNLGIDVGSGKHCPCPSCSGTDRFRFDNKDGDGSYFCNGCGAGDGISLIQKVLGLEFIEVVDKINDIVGTVKVAPLKKTNDYDVKKMLNAIWSESKKLTGSDFVSVYLHGRGLLIQPENVRACAECYESDSKTKIPAMVALVTCADGSAGAIHRTYLNGTEKADMEKPKKLTPRLKPLSGGAVRLFPLEYELCKGDTVGVAEGIETAIAATQLWSIPTWAVLGTSMLEAFIPPKGVKRIYIFSDNDANFAGQKAAYTLAHRLILEDFVAIVEVPDRIGDFNNVVKQGIK
jgi:putative DNA primase/helicase